MPDLFPLLSKYFHFKRGNDNLPILGKPLTGREMGRHQLGQVMNDLGFRTGIEIGAGQGVSAKVWCEAMPGLDLTSIDSYAGGRPQSQQRQDSN